MAEDDRVGARHVSLDRPEVWLETPENAARQRRSRDVRIDEDHVARVLDGESCRTEPSHADALRAVRLAEDLGAPGDVFGPHRALSLSRIVTSRPARSPRATDRRRALRRTAARGAC